MLAAVTVIAAKRDVGLDGLLLTLSYAIGAALPMLAIAFAGQRAARALRARAETVRRVAGVLVAAAALAIALGADQELQTAIPGYTESLQERFERSAAAQRELGELTGARAPEATPASEASEPRGLRPGARVPRARRAGSTPKPLTLEGLRGRVVLIDFWTYSCINCLRTLPYIREWDDRYRAAGLTIVGVHTPEFAFERVRVERARERDGARAPLSGRARQRLRDLGRLAQPVLAGEVPDRPEGPRPLLPLRRRRVRRDGGGDPDAPARARRRARRVRAAPTTSPPAS